MTNEQFTVILNARLSKIKETLALKADEYARGDRLSNFKKIAAFRAKSPEEVLFSLVAKHIAALDDFIQDIERGRVQPLARWDEKIGDIMSYMVLLDAMVQDRIRFGDEQSASGPDCNGSCSGNHKNPKKERNRNEKGNGCSHAGSKRQA